MCRLIKEYVTTRLLIVMLPQMTPHWERGVERGRNVAISQIVSNRDSNRGIRGAR